MGTRKRPPSQRTAVSNRTTFERYGVRSGAGVMSLRQNDFFLVFDESVLTESGFVAGAGVGAAVGAGSGAGVADFSGAGVVDFSGAAVADFSGAGGTGSIARGAGATGAGAIGSGAGATGSGSGATRCGGGMTRCGCGAMRSRAGILTGLRRSIGRTPAAAAFKRVNAASTASASAGGLSRNHEGATFMNVS